MDKDKPRPTKSNRLLPWRRHSLRWRLLALVGLMLVVTLLVIGLEVIYFVYNNEQRTWQGRQMEAARYASEIVAAFLASTQNTLRLVSLLEREELQAQPQLMADLLQESPTLLEIIRLDEQGQVLASAYRDAPLLANLFTIPQSRWFLESRAGRLYLGTVQLSVESKPYLIIALPAPDGGVVAARLHMRLLWDVMTSLHFGQTGRAYIINQDGLVIAHTDQSVPIANVRLMDRPEIAASLAAPGQNWAGSYVNFQGLHVVGVSAPVAGAGWLVITELPTQEAFATSRTAVLIFGLGLALFGLLVMLVTGRLLRQLILTPMEKLREGANRLGGGDLAYHIDLDQQNEVGQVAAAFNDMAARLRQQRQELKQRQAELEVLIQTSLSLTANLNLKTVLDVILNSTFKLLPHIEDVLIFLYQQQRLEFAASLWTDGRKDYLIAEPRPGGLTYQVAQRGEIMLVPDIQNHALYANAPAEWQGALLGLPLKIGRSVVGVMNVAYAQPHQFSQAELKILRLLGDQAAIAIENARLYEQAQSELTERQRTAEKLQQLNEELEDRVAARTVELTRVNSVLRAEVAERGRAEQALAHQAQALSRSNAFLGALGQVAARITSASDLDGMLQLLGAELEQLSISCFVALQKPDAPTLVSHFISSEPTGWKLAEKLSGLTLQDFQIPYDRWPMTDIIAHKQPLIIPDVTLVMKSWLPQLPLALARKILNLVGIQPDTIMFYLPLLIGEQVVGFFAVWSHELQVEDVTAISVFANQVAAAIENARLYKQAQLEIAERARAEEQIRASLHEKEVLLKEIHHRVKNNLQVISSLLNLQADSTGDEYIRLMLRDSQNRVRSMALIHEKLYRSENLAQIDFGDYIKDLVDYLFRSQNAYVRGLTAQIRADQIHLDVDTAVPCGLIINELVSNALKHAFPNGRQGETVVEMTAGPDRQVILTVRDNGISFPAGLDFRQTESLGLQLVNTLVEQLDGTIELESEQGTQFKITFHKEPAP